MPLNFVAKAAITVALTAANAALTMSRKIEGPRLDNLKFTSGDYGQPLPMVWGLRRMEVPVFWAEDLREVKRRRKTKGGKYNEYTYYGTWAVALAGHQIDAVRRIWFDTHIVYDLSAAGAVTPFDFGATGSIDDAIAIYLGTPTQDPDPRMQATVEAEFGEGSCPAYRDTAYIVFKDIPLEKLGNRIPQVSVEIVTNSSGLWPSEYKAVQGTSENIRFSPDYSVLLVNDNNEFNVIDTTSRQIIAQGDLTPPMENSSGNTIGVSDGGEIYGPKYIDGEIYSYDLNGNGTLLLDVTRNYGGTQFIVDGDGNEHWAALPYTRYLVLDGAEQDLADTLPDGENLQVRQLFVDLDGNLWAFGVKTHPAGSGLSLDKAFFWQLSGGMGFFTVPGLTAMSSASNAQGAAHYRDSDDDHFVFSWQSTIYAADFDGNVVYSYTASSLPEVSFVNTRPGVQTVWAGMREISLKDLTLVRQLSPSNWGFGSLTSYTVYDPIQHALIYSVGNNIRYLFLDRVGSDGVLLSTIAGDVAEMVGVETYEFGDLDQTITGWSATRGQASNMLEPLLDAYDSDIRPHDFGIQGIKRTAVTSGAAITTAWLAGDPRYSVTVRQELPRALLIDFADIDADQQPNTARADRPLDATDARGELKIDLTTLALDPDEAIQLANRHFRRRWNERKELTTALTARELILEPGDVRSLSLDGDADLYRCVSLTIKADDTLATEWRYDHPSLATLDGSAGATFDGRDVSVVVVPLLSKGFALDIPLIEDADDATVPQIYPLAAPYAEGSWPGATIYQAIDGEYSEELASKVSSDAATWGYVAEAMPYTNPNVWDRGTEITVTLQTGALTGCTEAAANSDPTLNLCAIGQDGRWELVQFTTATLTGALTYTLSGFKRGRRGTEWAAELHAVGDVFVLLDAAEPVAMGVSEVGTDVSFKAITAGRSTGFSFGYTYQGQTLMPYAPVHLKAVKESSGDWTFTWVRRTRIGGAWTGGSTIPLGEATEEYELTLGDGVTTVTKSPTSATYTWTVAEQTTDTGAEVMDADLEWSVAQVSDAVGAGFVATA